MIVIPAIDLRGGRCVRLLQGDFARETVYGDDPLAMARRWQDAGAPYLHLVDLDGARAGRPAQAAIIGEIARALTIPVQAGGGLRTLDDIAGALDGGLARVVLGTAALEDRALLAAALDRWGAERVVVGLDARDGLVATHGWRATSATRATDLARELAALGVRRVLYTDIARDGTLAAPNEAALGELAACADLAVLASGGVADRAHLAALAAIPGVEAAIVGRALYTGDVALGPGEWKYEVRSTKYE
ncbi:MAG TPA: 1-(5-phosphoribosyl)-5-[(5-phosphoribosylamino)methylideneamino]imidazole-4-carboxamide isomerase [Thermomicrobiales bacterium]|nr:1-(5-phosphoribosyl)-5-[(5-phosphoribosylamino)methylideneamino]imidazole-4-carboxamide isomerase [Thermomicrobiales bacterium]